MRKGFVARKAYHTPRSSWVGHMEISFVGGRVDIVVGIEVDTVVGIEVEIVVAVGGMAGVVVESIVVVGCYCC